MNVVMFNRVSNRGGSLLAGNLPLMQQRPALKSTQEKAERLQKAAGQIDFWENQKEKLKNMECSTLEDIARKLEKFHSYEDEIAAVKMQYNQEQMQHVMDEAKEIGEKIADAAEKLEPKTAEERLEEMAEEALGADKEKAEFAENIEELSQLAEELTEELTEMELQDGVLQENLDADSLSEAVPESDLVHEQFAPNLVKYKPFNLLI